MVVIMAEQSGDWTALLSPTTMTMLVSVLVLAVRMQCEFGVFFRSVL